MTMTKKKRSAAAIGRQSRRKGSQAQRDVANMLKAAGYTQARSRPANMPTPDGQRPSDLIVPELPWLNAEVKHDDGMTPWKLLEQAETQGTPGQLAVGFMRKDSRAGPGQPSDRPMVVVMRPEAWLELVRLAEMGRERLAQKISDYEGDLRQDKAKAWLRELREVAGPARDQEAIRADLLILAGRQVVGPGGNRAETVVDRVADDLGVAPLSEIADLATDDCIVCAACWYVQPKTTEAGDCKDCGEPIDQYAVHISIPRSRG